MVEKPLAINYQEALEMKKLSERWGIEIITNYETIWYPVTKDAYTKENSPEELLTIGADKAIANNPFSFFASVVKGKVKLAHNDPSSLSLNIVAMEILYSAVLSAKEGETIYLKH